MITLNVTHLIMIIAFFAGCSMSLVVYIYNAQLGTQRTRIDKIEKTQKECPISKVYTILEVLKNDVAWIKKKYKGND